EESVRELLSERGYLARERSVAGPGPLGEVAGEEHELCARVAGIAEGFAVPSERGDVDPVGRREERVHVGSFAGSRARRNVESGRQYIILASGGGGADHALAFSSALGSTKIAMCGTSFARSSSPSTSCQRSPNCARGMYAYPATILPRR